MLAVELVAVHGLRRLHCLDESPAPCEFFRRLQRSQQRTCKRSCRARRQRLPIPWSLPSWTASAASSPSTAQRAAPPTATGNFGATVDADELAVSLARTAAFFSNDQAPLSSRTVRFISGVHFPPGVAFTANAPLYGIENTNRGCALSSNFITGQAFPPALSISGAQPGLGITTGKADVNDSDPTAVNPGGVPIFKSGHAVGGIGVAGVPAGDVAEYAAFTAIAANGFAPNPASPRRGHHQRRRAAASSTRPRRPAGIAPGTFNGAFVVGPLASPGAPPDGFLVSAAAGPLGGLSAADVSQIISNAVSTANLTRAVIRLPIGSPTRMVIAVADLDGTIIGLYRMPDATVFSIDVAATKARNMVYFNSSRAHAAGPARRADRHRGHQPHHRLRRAAVFSAGNRRLAAGPVFSALHARRRESLHARLRAAGTEPKRRRFFPRIAAALSQRRARRRPRRERRRRRSGRLRDRGRRRGL